MKYTQQQSDFQDAILNGRGHVALLARAGTGKTTTILSAVKEYIAKNPDTEITICAYNKAIAQEMQGKLTKMKVNASWRTLGVHTLHSMGFGLLRFKFNSQMVDSKVSDILQSEIKSRLPEADYKLLTPARNLIQQAKTAGFGLKGCPDVDDTQNWLDLDDHYDVCDLEYRDLLKVINIAKYVYNKSLHMVDVVDFNDMILLPLFHNLNTKFTKDIVFVDEAQDLSITRQMLMQKFVKPGTGRIVIVGDDRQAIYGFTGADNDSMNTMIKRYNAEVLPLTTSWRCSVAVIEKAQTLVEDIEHAPGAAPGLIENLEELPEVLQQTDAILCRNTAPLIQQAYALIKRGIKCRVEGRALGAAILKLASRWKTNSILEYTVKLDEYVAIKRVELENKPQKLRELEDRYDAFIFAADYCNSIETDDMRRLRDEIKALFQDDVKNVITLCTYHRAKGREWDNVYLLEHDKLCPTKYATKDWQLLQEDNLAYVAFTRAKNSLNFVNKPGDN